MKNRKYCAVCHQLGNGTHFGAIVCKACAAFFKRTTNLKLDFKSRKENEQCVIRMSSRDSCKKCRYLKCLAVGMKLSSSSEDQSTSLDSEIVPSCSPRSPKFDTKLDQFQTPTLFKLYSSYQKLCSTRFNLHYRNISNSSPRPCNYVEFQKIYIEDVKLQNVFLEESYDEYKNMGNFEKQRVFKHFFVMFMMTEMGFRTHAEGRYNNFVVVNGDYIDLKSLDTFYHKPDENKRCEPTDAVKIYQPAFTQMKRNIVDPFGEKKLSIVEFLALVSLSVWNESIDNNPTEFYQNCQSIKEKTIRDLITYYEQDINEPDPLFRLSSILMLLPSIERSIQLFVQHVEFKNMFQCYAFHQRLYEIIHDVY